MCHLRLLRVVVAALLVGEAAGNSTESWLARRFAMRSAIFGADTLSNRSEPDYIFDTNVSGTL